MAYHIVSFKFWISWCPEIFFSFVCLSILHLSIFLNTRLPMGHWTGRSVLLQVHYKDSSAGVYSLTHVYILMSSLQGCFNQLWPFVNIKWFFCFKHLNSSSLLPVSVHPFRDQDAWLNVTVEGQNEWKLRFFSPSAWVWVLVDF